MLRSRDLDARYAAARRCSTSRSPYAATSAWRWSASRGGKTTLARCIAGLHHELERRGRLAASRRSRTPPDGAPLEVRRTDPVSSSRTPTHRSTLGARCGQTIARQLRLFFGLHRSGAGDARRRAARAGVAPGRGGRPLPRPALGRRAPARRDRARAGRRARCSSATRSPRRSTSRCRPRSSTCCIELRARSRAEHALHHPQPRLIRTIADRVLRDDRRWIVETGSVMQVFETPQATTRANCSPTRQASKRRSGTLRSAAGHERLSDAPRTPADG